jgi:pyrroloquinoline quinone biosynthesis protein E
MELLFVLPDYYGDRPRACMNGWGQRYLVVSPDGRALPCHMAHGLPGLTFDSVNEQSLEYIWRHSPAFAAFRGEEWMSPTCRSCDRRELDFGGCRCQAFHLTGDASATDPVCSLSPDHALVRSARDRAEHGQRLVPLRYRGGKELPRPSATAPSTPAHTATDTPSATRSNR